MRESDEDPAPVVPGRAAHDIHGRLDLIAEQLRGQADILRAQNTDIHDLDKRIKEVEIGIAKGGRFPAWAGGLLVLAITQIGSQFYLNGQVASELSKIPVIEAKCQDRDQRIGMVRDQLADHTARLKSVEERTQGGTHDRWTASQDRERMADFQRWVESEIRAIKPTK